MKNEAGYPLPDGELGEDEIVCQLVYLPDRPEYWQAFLASIQYLATHVAWERDTDKRGRDAAANWREAFELTIGCWRMTCLQDLQDDVAAILAIMELGNSCCDDMDITDGNQYTDRVEDGEGEVPQNIIDAGYAEDVDDWEGFDDYKCMIVHVTIDQMEYRLRELNNLLSEYGAYFGGAAAVAAVLAVAVSGGGLLIIAGMLTGIGVVSFLYSSIMEFGALDGLADDVATNHEELACAMYWADGDQAALLALNDKIDELFNSAEALILKNLNIGSTLKALYAGRYDEQDVADGLEEAGYDVLDFDCECDIQIGEFLYEADFEEDHEGFDGASINWSDTNGHYDPKCFFITYSSGGYARHSHNTLRYQLDEHIGVSGDSLTIHRISFWYMCKQDAATLKPRLTWIADGDSNSVDFDNSFDVWAKAFHVFSPPIVITKNGARKIDFSVVGGTIGFVYFDDIEIDVDAEDA